MSHESPQCRLCLRQHNDLNGDLNDSNLRRDLSSVIPFELVLGPGLPATICNCCKANLTACLDFRQRCLASDRLLRQQSPELFPQPVVAVDPVVVATPSLLDCQQVVGTCAAVAQTVSLESLDLGNETMLGELLTQPGGFSLPRQASAPAAQRLRSDMADTEDASIMFSKPSRSSEDLTGVINIEARFVVHRRGAEPLEGVARQKRRIV